MVNNGSVKNYYLIIKDIFLQKKMAGGGRKFNLKSAEPWEISAVTENCP